LKTGGMPRPGRLRFPWGPTRRRRLAIVYLYNRVYVLRLVGGFGA
jgi:hypothetical protein